MMMMMMVDHLQIAMTWVWRMPSATGVPPVIIQLSNDGIFPLNKVRFRNFTGLRNSDCATLWSDCATRLAQLGLRNSQDCATQIAQLPGLRNSDCATAFDGLRNSQDCATLLAQLHLTDCATLRIAQLRLRNSPDCATLIAQLHSTDCATLRIAQLCWRNCRAPG